MSIKISLLHNHYRLYSYLLLLSHTWLLLATPASVISVDSNPAVLFGELEAKNASSQNNTTISTSIGTKEEVDVYNYQVHNTNVEIDFILFLHHPLERQALGAAIFSGIRWIRNRIQDQGDDWLTKDDDPYISTVPGRVFIRIDSVKTASGRAKMTYKTLLSVFEGLWEALYLMKHELAVSLRVKVAGLTAGHGAIRVNDIPDLAAVQ